MAALVAPRALCIVNTDKDRIFPIDGVFKIYQSARRIYKLLGVEKNIGLQVAEGPHADTQPLNTGEFHWMTRFLQGAELMSTLDSPAVHSIPMEKLRVFNELPKDEKNTKIDESLVPSAAEAKVPQSAEGWAKLREGWLTAIKEKSFSGLNVVSFDKRDDPFNPGATAIDSVELMGVTYRDSRDPGIGRLASVLIAHRAGLKIRDLELIVLNVLDEQGWQEFANTYAHKFPKLFPEGTKAAPDDKAFEQEKKMFQNFEWGMAYVCPRGIGPTAWEGEGSAGTLARNENNGGAAAKTNEVDKSVRPSLTEKARVQRLRRFYLLGQTLEGQQVWDVRCAIRAVRSSEGLQDTKLWLQASRTQASNALMASLFEDNIARLDLHELPHSLMPEVGRQPTADKGVAGDARQRAADPLVPPAYLNMLRFLDLPQAAAMAAERTRVVIYDDDKAAWNYPAQVSEKLGWGKDKKKGLQLRDVPKEK